MDVSVPSKALCPKIGSALWKIDFLKMCKKDAFFCLNQPISAETTISGSKALLTLLSKLAQAENP